jgi:cytochrome c peroxidase
MRKATRLVYVFLACLVLAFSSYAEKKPQRVQINPATLSAFGTLPEVVKSDDNPVTREKVRLGRMLYLEKRLSRSGQISCDTCHPLDKYGVDHDPVSTGFKGQKGSRNAPTVFNAAGHVAQFWDGRAPDVESQAIGPVMNPVEMAMPSEHQVVGILRSAPEYREFFQAAFPDEKDPVTIANMGKAIAAFERTLVTPSRWDKFLKGDSTALTDAEKAGFNKFAEAGCAACHSGPYVGALMFQKVGIVKEWPNTSDPGRFAVTKQEADRMVFKVPSLRNIEKTGPYFHDGSVVTLEEAVKSMAEYQLGRSLSDAEVSQIVSWLKTLTGELPPEVTQAPAAPQAAKSTPGPEQG